MFSSLSSACTTVFSVGSYIMYLLTDNTVVLALLKDENIPQFLYDDDHRFVCNLPNSDKQYIGYKFYTDADVARFREGLDEYFA